MKPILFGKVAIIMGAGSSGGGISNGRAAALLFARNGASIFAVDAVEAFAQETVDAIRSEGFVAEPYRADVRSEEDVAAAVARCVELFGGVDILHNNVGVTEAGGLMDIEPDNWRRLLELNLTAPYLACRQVVPIMEARGGGSIINVSSLLALRARRNVRYLSYSVSKAGLNHFSRTVAMEYASRKIRVNNLILGAIDTPQVSNEYRAAEARIGKEKVEELLAARELCAPMGRTGTPWEVAEAALFLASDASRYTTGTDIYVDGGMSLLMD